MMMTIAKMKNVSKSYRMGDIHVRALNSTNLDLETGDFVAIVGQSGSGKTTMMQCLGGIERPSGGEVTIAGNRLSSLSDSKLSGFRASHLGFVFQAFNLVPVFSAYENVELPLIISKSKDRRERVMAALESVGLADHARHRPVELSGGQQQRVAIARALVNRPDIVIADEPTGSLDSKTGQAIIELLAEINRDQNTTIVLSTHNLSISEYANRTLTLADGHMMEG
jgi:putative ABC transport system ATP-binding protein